MRRNERERETEMVIQGWKVSLGRDLLLNENLLSNVDNLSTSSTIEQETGST